MSHVGVNLGFGNLHENLTDEQMYLGELALAELADRLGFDSLWAVEHHFDDYAMCPRCATRTGTVRPPRASWASPGRPSTGS